MIPGMIAATDIVMPRLKIAIVGNTGIGKSWLATSIADENHKVLDLDFDGRSASLAGKKNIFVKSYFDSSADTPKAITELESDINTWEYEYSKGKLEIGTFILDSATYMVMSIEREAIRQEPTNGRNIIRVPGGPKEGRFIKIGTGYDWAKINREYFNNIVSRLSAIGNLIVTFLDRDERDPTGKDPKTGKPVMGYTGKITVEPQHLAPCLATFNDVWWLHGESGYRSLTMNLSRDFEIGKNTLSLEGEQSDIDIKKLLAKSSALKGGVVSNTVVSNLTNPIVVTGTETKQ
jgi:hypothetical protein